MSPKTPPAPHAAPAAPAALAASASELARPAASAAAAAQVATATATATEAQWQALLAAARTARGQAYAPYSRFAVGAALLDDAGQVHAGCNIENAAYPQGQCAEASAIAHLVLAGGRRILAAVVVGVADNPVTPCGGCRQRLREFAADDCPVWVADLNEVRARYTLGQLLPASFGPSHLVASHAPSSTAPPASSAAPTALPAEPSAP